jgi:hypothetical protein
VALRVLSFFHFFFFLAQLEKAMTADLKDVQIAEIKQDAIHGRYVAAVVDLPLPMEIRNLMFSYPATGSESGTRTNVSGETPAESTLQGDFAGSNANDGAAQGDNPDSYQIIQVIKPYAYGILDR